MDYAECVVATNILGHSTLTYQIPEELKGKINPGSIVLVPIRARRLPAVVTSLSESTNIKNVKSIIDYVDDLPASTFKLLKLTADRYFVTLPLALRAVLPDIPIKKREGGQISPEVLGNKFITELILDTTDARIATDIKESIGQVLVIASTLAQAAKIYELLPNENAKILSSTIKKSEFFKTWQEFKDGTLKILISTRQGVFVPSKNLVEILVINEESPYMQSESRPRFNGADLAIELAKIKQIRVRLYSSAPRLKTYSESEKVMPEVSKKQLENLMQVVLLPNQIITDELIDEISAKLMENKKILLYHNRLGKARFVVCGSCKFIQSCPNCSVSMVLHRKDEKNILVCHQCNFRRPDVSACPNCGSKTLTMYGFGVQKIEEEIKSRFPSAKVSIYQSGDANMPQSGIVIATSAIFNVEPVPLFDLIGVIFADSEYYSPDFRANENTFRLVKYLMNLKTENGHLLLQSTTDRSETFVRAYNRDYSFYDSELADRKKFKLPPECSYIYIKYEHKDANEVFAKLAELKKILTRYDANIKGPTPAYISRVRGKTVGYLLFTLDKEISKEARDILTSLGRPFSIERDPLRLI